MFAEREAGSTIKFVDDYCQWYRTLFPEVRSFEAFKYLHVGMISDIKRKSHRVCETAIHWKFRKNREWDSGSHSLWISGGNDFSVDI
jgi:SRSO17 transposase